MSRAGEGARRSPIERWTPGGWADDDDLIAVEEPLELRLEGEPWSVTMRTPGDDLDLAAGYLITEGVIDGLDDIVAMAHVDDPSLPRGNTVDILLASGVPAARRTRGRRERYASSACGVCGVVSVEQTLRALPSRGPASPSRLDPTVLSRLPARLRAAQPLFDRTGGVHAAALCSADGELLVLREDVGRHNAVDKVIGARLRADAPPAPGQLLVVSGRVGFEIVQKGLMAGISALVAVGAPTSLAVELARRGGLPLVGFLREGRFNQYG